QISSFSNFARNMGGSVGTALLTTFLVRTAQVHQQQLAAGTGNGFAYRNYIDATKRALMAGGMGSDAAKSAAVGRAYTVMVRQASMLSYDNAFWVLAVLIGLLVPLPFIMRRPPRAAKVPEGAGAH
ncbi:MAG TPA: EmrB/QacA family drug resistance transporter, partial [Acidisarcina sp.]